jgi:hypothetical protein
MENTFSSGMLVTLTKTARRYNPEEPKSHFRCVTTSHVVGHRSVQIDRFIRRPTFSRAEVAIVLCHCRLYRIFVSHWGGNVIGHAQLNICVRFQVLTATSMEITNLRDIAPCSFVRVERRFRQFVLPSSGR